MRMIIGHDKEQLLSDNFRCMLIGIFAFQRLEIFLIGPYHNSSLQPYLESMTTETHQ